MNYMGSKRKHAKQLLKFILRDRNDRCYVEPFAGGMNVIDKVDGKRIANDNNKYLISMWKQIIYKNWIPPKQVTEEEYKNIRENKDKYDDFLVGYVGFNSYAAKFFGGYPRAKKEIRNYWDEYYRNIMSQKEKLNGVEFFCVDYKQLEIPPTSVIYCDPPMAELRNTK